MIDIQELRDGVSELGGGYLTDRGWAGFVDRLEAAEKERDALRAKVAEMEKQEPVGTLYDDGCFVWRNGRPYESNYAGWKMKLYALPGVKGE